MKIVRHMLFAVATLVSSVLALELALQAASWVVGATGRDPVTRWVGGATRVLALGDSNTYGLYLPEEDSYPKQMERLWNAAIQSPEVEIINLGYPGTNSSVLLNNLPGLLDTFRPDIVLIMIGANDFWTDVVEHQGNVESLFTPLVNWLRQHSRVHKLAYMVRRSFYDPTQLDLGERLIMDPETVDAEKTKRIRAALEEHPPTALSAVRYGQRRFDLGFVRTTGTTGTLALLERNLRALVERVSRDGSQPVLLTYPSNAREYEVANDATRRIAARQNIPLIDVSVAVTRHCPDSTKCPDLFFPDTHAKQPGYAIAARTLVADLRTLPLLTGQN